MFFLHIGKSVLEGANFALNCKLYISYFTLSIAGKTKKFAKTFFLSLFQTQRRLLKRFSERVTRVTEISK